MCLKKIGIIAERFYSLIYTISSLNVLYIPEHVLLFFRLKHDIAKLREMKAS